MATLIRGTREHYYHGNGQVDCTLELFPVPQGDTMRGDVLNKLLNLVKCLLHYLPLAVRRLSGSSGSNRDGCLGGSENKQIMVFKIGGISK